MEILKQYFAFIVCIVWTLATIGSTAYLFYYHKPHFAIASLCVSAMAFPYVKGKFKALVR